MPVSLLLCLSALYVQVIAAVSFFPCHGAKSTIHHEVTCTSIQLPQSICSHCPLRQTLGDGSFEKCDRIYDTTSSECMNSLQLYIDNNPCDVRRAAALKQLKEGDEIARDEIDYFLYSVCEQCCDCVPMGVKLSDYSQLYGRHSTSFPALWSETRGNCPAHARYDVCKVLPSIKSFGSFSNDVAICAQLNEWLQSDAAEEWQTNPEVVVNQDIQNFLRDILVATQCEERRIWEKCHTMEDKQHHLDLAFGSGVEDAPTAVGSEQPSPTPISGAVQPVPSSSASNVGTANDNEGHANSGDAQLTDEETVESVQTPSEGENTEVASDSGNNTSSSSTGGSNPGLILGESGASEGSSSYKPPILQGLRSCFPGSSTVQRRDGAVLRMEELQVGDEVLVSSTKYSPIYTFSHRSDNVYSEFVKVRTNNHTLHLSSKHSLYVNGKMRHAGLIRVGEHVQGQFGNERVVRIERERKWGLYNPHTIEGQIVVDGVLCSCFTGALSIATAQGLLSPFRGAFFLGARDWMLGWWLTDGIESLRLLKR